MVTMLIVIKYRERARTNLEVAVSNGAKVACPGRHRRKTFTQKQWLRLHATIPTNKRVKANHGLFKKTEFFIFLIQFFTKITK